MRRISNYHSHIALCGHAYGNVEDYVKEAIKYNKEIAEKLDISERTVKNHISNIFKSKKWNFLIILRESEIKKFIF